MRRLVILAVITLFSVDRAQAQRLGSLGVSTGAAFSDVTHATAAFAASAGVHLGIPWLVLAQRSVADLNQAPGSRRDISLAILPTFETLRGRLFAGVGATIKSHRIDVLNGSDEEGARFGLVGIAGIRLPVAGNGVVIELAGRVDEVPDRSYSALFGVRVRPGIPNTLTLGEPQRATAVVTRAAVWNDVLMQLILLQGNLESFSRIKEIETGIELEFDATRVTLWDDVAKVGRVLAAADPPVVITAFGPTAGRVAAAVTAGSFPAERLKLQRAERVYLRVEH